MAHLAIKGHATRGNEVIELLKMLGGINKHNYTADCESLYFYISDETNIIYYDWVNCHSGRSVHSLEQFVVKFPYKVGHKVIADMIGETEIVSMKWMESEEDVYYKVKDCDVLLTANCLQPTEEDNMQADVGIVDINLADYYKVYNEVEIMISDGWKFEQRGNKMFAIRTQYPKTYDECCKIMKVRCSFLMRNYMPSDTYKIGLIDSFQKLIICRDAYWKIAEDWKPDWNNIQDKHCIYVVSGELWLKERQTRQCTLAFPTAEMRDVFYENFKDLINECKELL